MKASTHNLPAHWVTPIDALTCVRWVQGEADLLIFCIPSIGDRSLPGLKNYQSCLNSHSGCRWQRIKQEGRLVGSCPSMAAEKLALDGTEPETRIPLGCPLPTAQYLCFHFFLSNWSSVCWGEGEVGVGARLTFFLWLSEQRWTRKLASLSSSVFNIG